MQQYRINVVPGLNWCTHVYIALGHNWAFYAFCSYSYNLWAKQECIPRAGSFDKFTRQNLSPSASAKTATPQPQVNGIVNQKILMAVQFRVSYFATEA